jgi:ribosome maturation factor RimP
MEVNMNISEKIKGLISSTIEDAGYILSDVTFEKEGKNHVLTVVIDKAGIITVDDCITVTNLINPILDLNDPISESYVLDVCSKEKGCE